MLPAQSKAVPDFAYVRCDMEEDNMKKWILWALLAAILLAVVPAAAESALPTVSFAKKTGAVNCAMTYQLALKADRPVAVDTAVSVWCAALKQRFDAVIPAGETAATVEIPIPADRGGDKVSFTLEAGEDYIGSRQSHALQVYSLPRVQFYMDYYVSHPGLELVVQVTCQNPVAVLGDNNVFTLRNQRGEVLAEAAWKEPKNRLRFHVPVTLALVGRQDLSVWLGETQVNTNPGYAYISDLDQHRVACLPPETPAVSITVDCMGMPTDRKLIDRLLAVLDKHQVKATFFMTGGFVEANLPTAIKIRDAGHEIANHSYAHPHMTEMDSYRDIRNDMLRCNRVIREKLGVEVRLFRPPFGETNEKITAIARGEGMEEIMYNIDSYDWSPLYTKSMVIERATNDKVVNGSIILFHLDSVFAPEVLDTVIPIYKEEKGFQCVTVGRLLEMADWPLPDIP